MVVGDGLPEGYIPTDIWSVDLNLWDIKDAWQVPENRDSQVSLPSLSKLLLGCPSGSRSPTHFTSWRGRKQQKAGPDNNGTTHRGVLEGLRQEPQHLHGLSGAQKDQHLGTRCARTRTYVCHFWSIWGWRQRLGFWSWGGDRFITEHRIRSSRAGAWIDNGSSLLASLSSYLPGSLRHLVTTALVRVSGFCPCSVWIICLDTALLQIWSLSEAAERRAFMRNTISGWYFALCLITLHVIAQCKCNFLLCADGGLQNHCRSPRRWCLHFGS